MKRAAIGLGSITIVILAGLATFFVISQNAIPNDNQGASKSSTPDLKYAEVVGGLEHPWDIDFLPDSTIIFTERSGAISKLKVGSKVVLQQISDVRDRGEGGLMGIAVDPDFQDNRYIYACLNSTEGDIKVARWAVDQEAEALTDRTDIISGIPSSDSGRHSGCQIAFGPDDNLWVGTGDAADETQPQDMTKLGGKILRVNRDGKAAPDNVDSPDKRIYSYGHRNTQALAFYPAERNESYGISVEHGPGRDDEINSLKAGNFGWAPGDNYDESVPMTDLDQFSDSIESVWSSGDTTIAPSGAAFLEGDTWGRLNGWLAVSVLKDQSLLLLNIADTSVSGTRTLIKNEFGRLRAATLGPDASLYVSTDNGSDDKIIKISSN